MTLARFTWRRRRKARGFTLMEMVIVFGIIGGIIAVIFAAASAALYRIYVNQASDELYLISSNFRSLYAARKMTTAPAACSTSFASNATYISSQVFPSEMVYPGPVANNPWNTASTTSTALVDICKEPGGKIVIDVRYANLTNEQCSDMVVRNSSSDPTIGLEAIVTTNAGIFSNSLPVTPIDAQTACKAGGNSNTVDWFFYLNN